MTPFLSMGGQQTSRVDFLYGTRGAPIDAPLVTAAEAGFHPLGAAGGTSDDNVAAFCATRVAPRGQYLGLFDADGGKRFALVQDDRGTFYERHHPRSGHAWRDWFYAAGYVLFTELDARWRATDVVLAHPTGHGWGSRVAPGLRDMPEAFLEGLGQALDAHALALRRVWFDTCCLDGPDEITQAAQRLARAGAAPTGL